MSLWTDNGTGWQKASLARVDNPSAAFLCCPGPSLAQVARDIRGPGRTVYAINSAYPHVRPDVWFGLDRIACHDPRVWFEPFAKVTRYLKDDTSRFRGHPNMLFADLDEAPLASMFLRRDPDTKFLWEHSTFLFALHFLYWLGHKQVYLIGCDMGGPADYHDGRELTREQRGNNRRLHDRQVTLLRELAPVARRHGLQWVSCTPGSRLNAFLPFAPLDKVLAKCTADMPAVRPLLHSVEADDIAEGKKKPAPAASPTSGPKWAAEACRKLIADFKFNTVLDVGAGTALEHSREFLAAGKRVTATDHQTPPEFPKGLKFIQSDFTAAESAAWKGGYDCVWCSHVLEHQRNPGSLIDRMIAALKPNGILAVTVPPLQHAILGGHLTVWNMGLLCYNLVLAGLDLRKATLLEADGNITVIVRKKTFDLAKLGLHYDKGDIEQLARYFPVPGLRQGFDGRAMANQ
ncbi:MAG: class I SAM-dependent methyltransferase [Chthoniobacter sp.]|uniref:class I SAM-dependent methyltransferase n=1 Tax=Chthoniobacter sp. TaxID=2510640 RepID=UPI0032A9A223